ncbi:MAG: hypothetical protein E7513_06080 [Ruminococcaceae bacterium]|nr:hypothetical protein [Oscillospiraceae bacterium]
MKKLIIVFGVFAIICVIITAVAEQRVRSLENDIKPTESIAATDSEIYTLKSENGRIVVYRGDELLIKTTTAVSTLPKRDQTELLYGISANSKEEMNALLESYCS